jgi:hypothetical protein
MMWWDRRTFAKHAAPDQLPKILDEMRLVSNYAEAHRVDHAVAQ